MVGAAAGCGKRPTHRGLSGTAGVAPGSIAAKAPNWRPVRHRGRRCILVERGEVAGAMDHLAADNRQRSRDVGDLVLGTGEVVAVGHDQVGELTDLDATLFALLVREPGDVFGPHSERRLAVE